MDVQFELASELDKAGSAAKKSRPKVIQDDDDDETEWNQDQLEDNGAGEGSVYEVRL